MTTITASPALASRHMTMRQEGVHAFVRGIAYPPRMKRGRVPAKPATVESRDPTPERAEKATGVVRSKNPPFTSQIVSTYQKFQKQLGPDAVMILDRFCELAHQASSSRGLTAAYSGMSVDQSYSGSTNMSERQRMAHTEFRAIWDSLGPDMRKLAMELILELPISPVPTKNGSMPAIPVVGDQHRKYADIGRELCGYADDRRGMGAAVAALRILSWRVQELLGGHVPARRRFA